MYVKGFPEIPNNHRALEPTALAPTVGADLERAKSEPRHGAIELSADAGARKAEEKLSGMDVYLETDRLILRRFTRDDFDLLLDLDSDPEVMRYLTDGQPSPPDRIHQGIDNILAGYAKSDRWGL